MNFAQNPNVNAVAGVILVLVASFKVGSSFTSADKETADDRYVPSERPAPPRKTVTPRPTAPPTEYRVQAVSEQLVSDKLKAPATARFGPVEILKREHPWYQTVISVDAQNSFGALIRERFVCTFKLKDERNFSSHVTWGVVEYGEVRQGNEAVERVLQMYRELSGWDSPK